MIFNRFEVLLTFLFLMTGRKVCLSMETLKGFLKESHTLPPEVILTSCKITFKRYTLGNPAHAQLLLHFRPRYWFSAHLHTRFTANVHVLLFSLSNLLCKYPNSDVTTQFLSLDKIGPRKQFYEVYTNGRFGYSSRLLIYQL